LWWEEIKKVVARFWPIIQTLALELPTQPIDPGQVEALAHQST